MTEAGVWRLVLAVSMIVAIWRVTRLLVLEDFPPVRAVRDWMISTFGLVDADGNLVGGRRLGGIGYAVAYIWTCPWCMSAYVGGLVWWAADWRLSVPFPWLILAAGSGLSGVMSWVESEHEQRWKIRDRDLEERPRR